MFNIKSITNILGILMMLNGFLMFLCLPFSWYYGENDFNALLISGSVTLGFGLVCNLLTIKHAGDIKKREGFLLVTLGWVFMSLFGCLPYLLSGAIPNFTDAYYETISGFTTAGSSILNDIEALPKGVLFWRSMTQWIGGMGIIVLTLAILPILGIGGMELFVAEVPGVTYDKLHPRITETAKRLWALYVLLTGIETLLLWAGGMSFYDAINHSLATLSTGGFSTKQASVGYWDSAYIQYVIILFMFLAGTNFTIIYFLFKLNFKNIFKNDELKWYISGVLGLSIVVSVVVYMHNPVGGIEYSIRTALFQVVSIVTTTGFATADYMHWGPFATMIFFMLLFSGACAGSTSGGIKIVRHVLMMKNTLAEFKRRLHPRAIVPVRMNNASVHPNIIYNVLAFFLLYIFLFITGSLILTFLGLDILTSLGAVATSLGNIGPGIGSVGPSANFYHLPDAAKWLLSVLMLVGRLELFTVLILFTPYFWRRN